jgi:putative inorganic carbon (HCO3(-)) transporter
MFKREVLVFIVFMCVAAIATGLGFLSVKLAIGFALGITIGIVTFIRPMYGLLLYVFHIVFAPQYFLAPLRHVRSMLMLAGVVLLSFFVHKIFRREPIHAVARKQDLLMLALLAIVPTSNLVNFRMGASFTGFMDFLTVYFLYFMIVNIVDDYDKLRLFSWVTVFCIFGVAVDGVIQRFRGVDFLGIEPVLGRIRYVGIMSDPNDFALALVSFLPFTLAGILDKSLPKYRRAGLLGMIAVLLAGIYFADSRGGFLALLAILTIFSFKRWGVLRGSLVGLFFIIVGIVLSPSRMDQLSPYESSAEGRVEAWVAGLNMLKHHPIFGVGFKNFIIFHFRAAHSAYVNCFAELGFVGYFVWLALIVVSFTGLFAAERENLPGYSAYARTLQMSLTGFLVGAFFLSQTYGPVLYILVALSAAVTYNPESRIRRTPVLGFQEVWKAAAIAVGSLVFYQILAILYY